MLGKIYISLDEDETGSHVMSLEGSDKSNDSPESRDCNSRRLKSKTLL